MRVGGATATPLAGSLRRSARCSTAGCAPARAGSESSPSIAARRNMGVEDDTRVILTPMSVLPSLALGLALGVRHAADADHVAAVATIVTRGRSARGAAVLGAWWGIGHSASVLLAGGALVEIGRAH